MGMTYKAKPLCHTHRLDQLRLMQLVEGKASALLRYIIDFSLFGT